MPDAGISGYGRAVKKRLNQDLLPSQLKQLVAALFRPDLLEPEAIPDDAPLLGGSCGVDSADVLELALCIEEEFGVAICGRPELHPVFDSIASLAGFIVASGPMGTTHQRRSTAAPAPDALAWTLSTGEKIGAFPA